MKRLQEKSTEKLFHISLSIYVRKVCHDLTHLNSTIIVCALVSVSFARDIICSFDAIFL